MPPKIEAKKCDRCGICIFECGRSVFVFDMKRDRIQTVRPSECVECFICEERCPKDAIKVYLVAP